MAVGHSSSIASPADDWQLTGTTNDTITGLVASLHGTHRWTADPTFTTVLSATGGYLTPPPSTVPARPVSRIAISLWFKTSAHGGVLASLQSTPLTSGITKTAGYAPLLYIGIDGHLRGLWPAGPDRNPLTSPGPVATGTWQHVVLTAIISGSKASQILDLNGKPVAIRVTKALTLAGLGPATNLTFAAGYIGGAWPSQPNHHAAHPDYYTGQLADITIAH